MTQQIETAGAYTAAEIAERGISEDLNGMKIWQLIELPAQGYYLGDSALGAQRWAVEHDATATIVGRVGEFSF